MNPLRFLIAALALAALSNSALACKCAGRGSACQAVGQSAAIFIGTVKGLVTEKHDFGGYQTLRRRVTFDRIESFRGTRESQITVVTGIGGGDCGGPFQEGKVYLVYAYDVGAGLETGICTRTAPVDDAAEDVGFLRSLASKGPEGRISGYVTTQRPSPAEDYDGKGAIPGVSVWMESDQGRKQTTTNAKGEYEFAALPPGQYRLWADLPAKLGGGGPVAYTLEPQSCVSANFIAQELGTIRGSLRDAYGQPVRRVWVELLRASDGRRTGIQDGFTNDLGAYRISNVPKGEYLLGVHVTHPPTGTEYSWDPYTRNYYPGVPDAHAARTIAVNSAQVITGIDWTIGAPLERRVIRGIVLGPDDKPARAAWVELKVDGYDHNAALKESSNDGSFALEGLTSLRYIIQASSQSRTGPDAWHCHRLPVPAGNVVLKFKLDHPGKDCDECRTRH
ncbi:MAG: hypothetical protein IT168_09675 [Bryobacterales bacterium]|nr:hypothetical protein [Bryobacterales bacterium]